MTVKNGIDNFLSWKATHLKSNKAYLTALKPLVDRYGDRDLSTLTINDVSRLIDNLTERYSHSTVFYFTVILKMFARYAHYSHIKTVSPELIKSKKIKVPIKRPYVIEDDVTKLCRVCDQRSFMGVRNTLIICMLFDTGARVGELVSLTIEDLGDGQTQHAIVETLKNGNPRYLAWSKTTHRILQTYLAMRISKNYRTNMLLINRNGSKLTARGIQYMISILREEAGIKKEITPHSFRHGKAHKMIRSGANVKEIGAVLGHSEENAKSALQYLRLDASETLEIARKFV